MAENIESTDGSNAESSEQIELSPVELQAKEAGWVPKEEFDGEEHKWVDAGEFLRRGELFKKIEDQNKQLKDVRNALAELKKLNSQVREVEYKRALDTLRKQKKEALENGDAEAVIAAEERIDLVKEQQQQLKSQPADVQAQEGTEHPEFVAWVEQNSWYKSSAPMKAFADTLGDQLAKAGNSPSEVLRKVAAEVRKEFPHRFNNPNREKAGAVEASKGSSRSTGSFVLSDDERRIMNNFVRTGALTEKEYIDQLKKVRG